MSASSGRLTYMPALDSLRGVGVLAVVAFHSRLLPGGFVGVDLFFVLSGFLITSLLRQQLEEDGRIDFGRFYLRRVRRLVPALLCMLAAYVLIMPALTPDLPATRHYLNAALAAAYITNFFPVSYIGHTWSLGVEEQFYLVWPALLPILIRWRPILVFSALYVALTAYRVIVGILFGWEFAYPHPDTHGTGLILGAMASYLPRVGWAAAPGAAILVAVCVLAPYHVVSTLSVGIPLGELAALLLILGRDALEQPLTLLRPIGLISYAVYLWHYPIVSLVRQHFGPLLSFAITLSASIVLATISYFTVEAAFRARRPRLSTALGKRGFTQLGTGILTKEVR